MRIAITGANGQVGGALKQSLASHDLLPLTRPDYDISDPAVVQKIAQLQPDLVIHAAAMTNVDQCAKEPQTAYLVNSFGTQNVALACYQVDAPMLHISTNEVFDGTADVPYHEFAPTRAINPYAQSKLAGEQIAARLVRKLYIVRTSWVFANGGNNFPAKIIRAADAHGKLRVVTDEVSAPTYAPDLAQAIRELVDTHHYGTYHFCNDGICSRYDYALEVLKQSGRSHIPVEAITSNQFERASVPPPYAPLQNNLGAALGIILQPWQNALSDYFVLNHKL